MNIILDMLGNSWEWITSLSLGTIAFITISTAKYFKKDKFLAKMLGVGYVKASNAVGKENFDAFINIAKDVKVNEIPQKLNEFVEKQVKIENMLALIIKMNLENGVLDDNISLKEEAEELLWEKS